MIAAPVCRCCIRLTKSSTPFRWRLLVGVVSKQWAKTDPVVKFTLLPVGGSETDELDKAAIDFRSSSTTPCVLQLPTTAVGEFAGSGYLASLNSYVKGSSAPTMWTNMPKSVQDMGTINGVKYSTSIKAITPRRSCTTRSCLKGWREIPWNPKNWQDILTTAQKVKKANPKVWAIWLNAGHIAGRSRTGSRERKPHRRLDEPDDVRH